MNECITCDTVIPDNEWSCGEGICLPLKSYYGEDPTSPPKCRLCNDVVEAHGIDRVCRNRTCRLYGHDQ